MPKVLLITQSFPYLPGEQFLEDEVRYWAEAKDVELTIAPLTASGEPRVIPDSVQIDTSLARFPLTAQHFIRGMFSVVLWQECLELLRLRKLSPTTIKEAAKAIVRVQHAYAALMAQGLPYDIIYCYWNDVGAYAAAMAKRSGKCAVLVSRAHGFDLYEDRRAGCHLPLKRQFILDFDRLFVISHQARRYALSTFGDFQVNVSRLGVPVSAQQSPVSPEGRLRVLSVSFCVALKRIDRIMDGVAEFARSHPELNVDWVHFGDGALRASLIELSQGVQSGIPNLRISFPGQLPNSELRQRMAEEPWDVLVNASESEGVPVSIMEAMSFGIPAIATNVGGVSELVDNETGVLLDADANGGLIAIALGGGMTRFKSADFRSRCSDKIAREFNAELNYRQFVRSCLDGTH